MNTEHEANQAGLKIMAGVAREDTLNSKNCGELFDKCAQCDVKLSSTTDRTDLLCEYHAGQ